MDECKNERGIQSLAWRSGWAKENFLLNFVFRLHKNNRFFISLVLGAWLVSQVRSPAQQSGLRIQHCHTYSIGHDCGSALTPGPGTPYAAGWPKKIPLKNEGLWKQKHRQSKISLDLRITKEGPGEVRITVYDLMLGEDENAEREKETQRHPLSPGTLDDGV